MTFLQVKCVLPSPADLWDVVSVSEFWKGPPGAVLSGLLLMWLKGLYDAHQQRLMLLKALDAEVSTASHAIKEVLDDSPSKEMADAFLRGVKAAFDDKLGQDVLTFEVFDCLQSGWVLFAPSFSYVDLISKLHKDEATAAILYIDAWARATEYERRYASYYSKFLDLIPMLHKREKANELQLKELAELICGTLGLFLGSVEDVRKRGTEFRLLAAKGLRRWYQRKPATIRVLDMKEPDGWGPPKSEPRTLEVIEVAGTHETMIIEETDQHKEVESSSC